MTLNIKKGNKTHKSEIGELNRQNNAFQLASNIEQYSCINNNVTIHGIPHSENENMMKKVKPLNEKLKVEIFHYHIGVAHSLSSKNNTITLHRLL